MSDRREHISTFLETAEWQHATLHPIAGDMSSRRYFRLNREGQTAILMDAASDMTSFVQMTKWLADLGLSAPEIIYAEPITGLILLEDFGDTSMKKAVRANSSLKDLSFELCLDVLVTLRDAPLPKLHNPDPYELVAWTEMVDDHLLDIDAAGLTKFRAILLEALTEVLSGRSCVSLRDFHSENVMWLPDRNGPRKLGLLDYQDAFITHTAYDLMSLLTDARTRVSANDRQTVVQRYLQRTGDNPEAFELALAVLSAQRNLRILGVFARAGKPFSEMQHTFEYLKEALSHPVFAAAREETLAAFPKALTEK